MMNEYKELLAWLDGLKTGVSLLEAKLEVKLREEKAELNRQQNIKEAAKDCRNENRVLGAMYD